MRKDGGITLIALIITIIILLILVGVSINLAIKGDLFSSTQKAVSGTNAKVEEEQTRVDELMDELMDELADITKCKHPTLKWEGNVDGTHSGICEKCGETVSTEEHTYENGTCKKCEMITFYVETTSYTSPKGMTWEEWCDTDYAPYAANLDGTLSEYKFFKVCGDHVGTLMGLLDGLEIRWDGRGITTDGTINTIVPPTEVITQGGSYFIYVYCLAWDTEISVVYEDEKGRKRVKKKKIQDLKPGDEILSFDWETMKLVPNKVKYVDGEENKTHYELDKWTFDDGTVIETVHRHEFYNVEAKRFKYMDEWKIGEHAYKQDGTKPMLVAHEVISKVVKHCTIVGEKGTNYFANDLLSGDRTCPKDIEL